MAIRPLVLYDRRPHTTALGYNEVGAVPAPTTSRRRRNFRSNPEFVNGHRELLPKPKRLASAQAPQRPDSCSVADYLRLRPPLTSATHSGSSRGCGFRSSGLREPQITERQAFKCASRSGPKTRVMVAATFRQRIRALQDEVTRKNRPRLKHATERNCLKRPRH